MVLCIILAWTGQVDAKKKTKLKRPPPLKGEVIGVTADSIEQIAEKDTVIARGRVLVRYQDKAVRADYIKINTETGSGEARGHVIISSEDTYLKADRTSFNLKTQQGKIFNVDGTVAEEYFIKGKEVRKYSEKHYKMAESSITTCEGKLPDWVIEVRDMDLVVGDRAFFRGGVFKIRNKPVLYLPIGYVPLDNERKSGLLMPVFGTSNTDGFFFNSSFYWAINRQSDATFYLDYLQKRGIRPGIEYRYTPSKKTKGQINASFLEDDVTGNTFWKVDAVHSQVLPKNILLDAQVDLVSEDNFDKTFVDDTTERTRRSTDSFISLSKTWANSSFDILARYRTSTEDERDDALSLLPQITHKIQKRTIGKTNFYFNQDTSYTVFQTDLDPDLDSDDTLTLQRFDIHPQISRVFKPASWLTLTPKIGVRETYYSKGVDDDDNRLDGFSREMFDVNTVLEGPEVFRIFSTGNSSVPKIKHLIEPKITYDYIPDIDEDDRDKIEVFDAIDSIDPKNRIKYALTQRVLAKKLKDEDSPETVEVLRFEVSQTYDIREATADLDPGESAEPFSRIRFDLDSQFIDPLLVNFDTTYSFYDSVIETFNFEVGIKPTDWLTLFMERRFTRNSTTYLQGTIDLDLKKGWNFAYSTRFDEREGEFSENDFSLSFEDKCACWGFSFDLINRKNINDDVDQNETKFLFSINLTGIGSFGTKKDEGILHQTF